MPSWNRPGAICPGCGAQERHRAVWLYLRARRPELFSEALSVLHFAPEESFQRRLSALTKLRYVTADLELPHASEHFDIVRIPYPDDSFDVILCVHVLEHVEEDRRAMRELARVLKPDGWALILVPMDEDRAETYEDAAITAPRERERAFWQHDHVRLYGRDFPERLREEGFRVTVDPYVRDLDQETVARHGLGPHVMYVGSPRS
jgi:SAM-dependent methyltransferase